MNALKEYTFVSSPLWRISDGKDLVCVELFHKVLPTNRYKKRAESRRQPAPSAGKWPHQPVPVALQKPTDLDLHCLSIQGISGVSRTSVNKKAFFSWDGRVYNQAGFTCLLTDLISSSKQSKHMNN